MQGLQAIDGVILLLLGALAVLIAVLWILWALMPFAVFGTKDLLRELIREQRKTNELLLAEAKRTRAREGFRPDDDLRATR